MDFQNVNLLNSRINMLSGNLLPISADDSRFSICWRLHSIVVWLFELIQTVALISGVILVPKEKVLKDGSVCIMVTIEASFMLTRLYIRKKLIEQMIRKMNNILYNADETMKDMVKSLLKPLTIPFIIYGLINVISITVWTAQPITLIFDRSTFFYVDYKLPAVFTSEPFSNYVLFSTTIIMTISSVYLFLKKYGVDIYMIHLVLLLTAQYRYTAQKLTMLFQSSQNDHNESRREHRLKTDNKWAEKKLRELCRHQNTVLNISTILKELLSINFSLLYLNSVFRFCFIGILISTIPSISLAESISIISFAFGSIVQFFFLCFSLQTLSDASTEITDKAFDEAWYEFGPSMKRTFILLIMHNVLECRIAAIDKFNLSLPSFMTIMNQSYSIALLFLKAK